MRIISIVAPGNGSGKTTAAAAILSAFPGRFHAAKFTTVFRDGVNCPRGPATCACRRLDGPYTVVTDPTTIETPGTDTGKLARAGAISVHWCLCRPDAHAEAWRHFRERHLPASADLVTEGNSIVPHIDPDLLLMVASPATPRRRWKPDSLALARAADVLVLNDHGASAAELSALGDELTRLTGRRRPAVVDLSTSLATWRETDLSSRIASLLEAGDRPRP